MENRFLEKRNPVMKKKHTFGILWIVFSLILLFVSTKNYLGYKAYFRYKSAKEASQDLDINFPAVENPLKQAAKLYPNPNIEGELAQLYLERAIIETQKGSMKRRDEYLEEAQNTLRKQFLSNPADYRIYYRIGLTYFLQNYPEDEYFKKADDYFQKALDLNPNNEFLCLNIFFLYFSGWEILPEKNREFTFGALEKMVDLDRDFIRNFLRMWKENHGNYDSLIPILKSREALYEKISSFIR
jgi:tetratricopeptide (TPR) repeat protein